MRRVAIPERANWRELAAESGFAFHTIGGEPYWDESAYYAFTLREIEEDIEGPTEELHLMAIDIVDDVVNSEQRMRQLDIPEHYWDWIARSWKARDPHLYGRMDFAYDGRGPAKLYEFNYDTPTSLFESAFFQWQWLDDQQRIGNLPVSADQFNSIYERLVEAFGTIARSLPRPFYLSAVRESAEDQGTVSYLYDCAVQAGIDCGLLAIEDIGVTATGRYTDLEDNVIGTLFKLYPLEDLFREDFGRYLPDSGLLLIEPPWKAVLSNKGILPILWEKHQGHPNLLPAYFDSGEGDLPRGWVRKPLYSREGANVEIHLDDGARVESDGPYRDGLIRQAFHPLAQFDGRYALLGSWVVGDRACGLGIREDASPITKDSARFVPHVIVDEPQAQGVLMA
ncbi:MAG: glutathionylspermidine synthase family protein [Xanthomonadaceae bacterium]|jgi:glutathionylspermidine synthase|nr:glutathionylspermidine synthase family protein [Xanthomonadaceae bacterium]